MKIHLRMLGCRLNQSEIETMARQFRQLGHEIVHDAAQAEQVIVNTCAVTHDATRDSRKLIKELHRNNPNAALHVTGCYAQISPQEIQVLPGVNRVVGNREKDGLVETLTGQKIPLFDLEPVERDDIHHAAGRTRAFIKVQDGCDNACTFCVTTVARGEGRSRAINDVVNEVRYMHMLGYQEAVLTGVHLGSYGHDVGNFNGLAQLVLALLKDTDMPRIRLSSLEPWDLSERFFDLWENPRVCRHLHLPLQSGCDATLRRMARRTTQAQFRQLVQAARERIPAARITSDVIVGFPGETDTEFDTSEAFIRDMNFAGLHVFRYSIRVGTPAARMKGHIREETKKARSARLIALSEQLEQNFAGGFDGQTLDVLWEHISGATEHGFINSGYTDNYIRVRAVHPRVLTNHITPTQIGRYNNGQSEAIPVLE